MDPILACCWLLTQMPWVCVTAAHGTETARGNRMTSICAVTYNLFYSWCSVAAPYPMFSRDDLWAPMFHIASRNLKHNGDLSHWETSTHLGRCSVVCNVSRGLHDQKRMVALFQVSGLMRRVYPVSIWWGHLGVHPPIWERGVPWHQEERVFQSPAAGPSSSFGLCCVGLRIRKPRLCVQWVSECWKLLWWIIKLKKSREPLSL